MAWVSLGLSALFGVFALGVRSWLHRRATGRSPLRSGLGPGGLLAVLGVTTAFTLGAIDDLVFNASRLVHSPLVAVLGIALAISALAMVWWSQAAMGASLRIGVDPSERTALVTAGPFRWVRNPIYAAMMCYVIGTALFLSNVGAIAACVALIVAEQIQVRRIEEPYLTVMHGEAYLSYAALVGRFVPGLGRLQHNRR